MAKKFPPELDTPREDMSVLIPDEDKINALFPNAVPVFFESEEDPLGRFEAQRLAEDLRLLPVLMQHYGIPSEQPLHDASALLGLVLAMARQFVPAYRYRDINEKDRGRPSAFWEYVSLVGLVEHARQRGNSTLADAVMFVAEYDSEEEEEDDEEQHSRRIEALLTRYKRAIRDLRQVLGPDEAKIRRECKALMAKHIPWDKK